MHLMLHFFALRLCLLCRVQFFVHRGNIGEMLECSVGFDGALFQCVGWCWFVVLMMLMVVLTSKRTVVSTFAGGGNAGFYGPHGVAVDASGNVFVADLANNRICKVTAVVGMLLKDRCPPALFCVYSVCEVLLACWLVYVCVYV